MYIVQIAQYLNIFQICGTGIISDGLLFEHDSF